MSKPKGPLEDIRILDLTVGEAAECGKLLADLGADTIKIEPPGGDPARQAPPFLGDRPAVEGSLTFWYDNGNKRLVRLDPGTPSGRVSFLELVADADVLIESDWRPESLGLPEGTLAAINRRLIRASISPFGRTGPHAGYQGNDLTAAAASGLLLAAGEAGRPPLRTAGSQADRLACRAAVVAILAAIDQQRRTGRGQSIDISRQEAGILQSEAVHLTYEAWRRFADRLGQGQTPLTVPALAAPTRDGYCHLSAESGAEWRALVAWLNEAGQAGELADDRYHDPTVRLQHRAAIHGQLTAFTREWTRSALVAEAARRGIPCVPVQTPLDVVGDPSLAERGFWIDLRLPATDRPVRAPGLPYRFDDRAPEAGLPENGRPAGARADQPSEWIGWEAPSIPIPGSAPEAAGEGGPLAGLRIVDFTEGIDGPFATWLLADLGASVIKVEAPGTGDPLRTRPPLHHRGTPPNNGGLWSALNRNKRSVVIDLDGSPGQNLARRLIGAADVVVENFGPGVFERRIGDPETFRADRPHLIVARLSAFGQTGSRRDDPAGSATLQALAGLTYLTADDETRPEGTGAALADYLGGFAGTIAILAALRHRRRTGRGLAIDVSRYEALIATLAPALIEATALGRNARPTGNRLARYPDAPQGVYACRLSPTSAADPVETEAWVAIAVTRDTHWTGLRKAIGNPAWSADPALATAAGRIAAAATIDERLAEWTRQREAWEAFHLLQAAGVPAAVVENGRDLLDRDRHLRARGFWLTVRHPEMGQIRLPGPPFRFDGAPARATLPPPRLGEHTEAVLREVLELAESEIAEIVQAHAV